MGIVKPKLVVSQRCIRQRAVESEHIAAGGFVTQSKGPVVIFSRYRGDVPDTVVDRTHAILLRLSIDHGDLTIVVEVEVLIVVVGVHHGKVDSVRHAVPDHSILECGRAVGTVSDNRSGGAVDVEIHRVCAVGRSLCGNDVLDCLEAGCGKGVGADTGRNERDVGCLEGIIIEGLVEADGLESEDGIGYPVASVIVVNREIGISVDHGQLSVVGVNAVGCIAVVGVAVCILCSGDTGSVHCLGSPGIGDARIGKCDSGVVTLAGLVRPGVVRINVESHIGCVGRDVCIGCIRVAHGCEDAGHHDRCD